MTIAIFKKITLFGEASNQEAILDELQSMGFMHLIAMRPHKIEKLMDLSTSRLDQANKALAILKNTREKAKPREIDENFNSEQIVDAILNNEKQLREAIDRGDFLAKKIKELSSWGNFVLPNKDEMKNILFWFYKIKHRDVKLLPNNFIWQEVHSDNQFIYLVVLSEKEPPPSAFPAPRVHTGSVPLAVLRQEFQEISQKIDDLNEERRHLTRYRWLLNDQLANFTDKTMLQQESQKILVDQHFYVIQGWVPEDELEHVQMFAKKLNLAMSIEEASSLDKAPTLLQTYPWTRGGVEIVNFYQLPGYHALDPSFMVFFSFALFFAMILADAGYGFVIAFFTLISWKRLNQSKNGHWIKPLLITISLFSIIYGVIVGSYFGIEPRENNFLHRFVLLHINNFNAMMMVAVIVGCIHVMVANAMRAWFAKHLEAKFESIGFIFLISGLMGLSYALLQQHDKIKMLSIFIIAASLLSIMIFASDIPVTDFKSFVKRSLKGLLSISEITAMFSDILSYLRLFALGLAGASLAITINHIATSLSATGTYGWILAGLVFLLGQTLNFALCIMSAVIHGLRLNYIEFYKWSIKEEGYAYEPLKKTEVSHE